MVCALPANVLLLSRYCPVAGSSIVIATTDSIVLAVPSDETDLAGAGWADKVRTFENRSLSKLELLIESVQPVLAA